MANKVEKSEFEKHSEENQKQDSIVVEFLDFIKHNKKWWLIPIIVVVLLLGVLMVMTNTGVAPLIYTIW